MKYPMMNTAVKKNEIFFIADRGEAFVRDYLWASRDKSIINASK
jgi:hypothetical protein